MGDSEQDVRTKRQLARAEQENAKARNEAQLVALKNELEGYERSGKSERSAQVKAEINRLERELRGGRPAQEEKAVKPPAEQRSAPKRSSAKK